MHVCARVYTDCACERCVCGNSPAPACRPSSHICHHSCRVHQSSVLNCPYPSLSVGKSKPGAHAGSGRLSLAAVRSAVLSRRPAVCPLPPARARACSLGRLGRPGRARLDTGKIKRAWRPRRSSEQNRVVRLVTCGFTLGCSLCFCKFPAAPFTWLHDAFCWCLFSRLLARIDMIVGPPPPSTPRHKKYPTKGPTAPPRESPQYSPRSGCQPSPALSLEWQVPCAPGHMTAAHTLLF